MSKGSGNTRNASKQALVRQNIVDYIKDPYHSKTWGYEEMDAWENLSENEQYELLQKAGFTGLVSDDDIEFATLHYAANRHDLASMLAEDLSNIAGGYGIDDSVMWTIQYKDGHREYLGEFDSMTDNLGVKDSQSYKTQISKVNSHFGKAAFVIRSDGYEQPRYWVNKDGMQELKKYGGFKEYKSGKQV